MIKLNLFLLFIKLVLSKSSVDIKLTDIIQSHKGPVQGKILNYVQNSSIEYSAFEAIPFGKPPINELRYQPPIEVEAWSETLMATSNAPYCPQIGNDGTVIGDEDCLYLNVYSPLTTFNDISDNNLLAVIVWIYGGSFAWGTITSKIYGPDFIVSDNVVLVNMNYRLGPLGYLTLDIPEATGNMGMKDQVLALKWVQKNIKKFGGDPNKVTIFGQSSGSDSAMLHQLSPAAKGLFRGVIAMSGVPLNPWGFSSIPRAMEQAFDIGRRIGFDTFDKIELYKRLKNATVDELVYATDNQTDSKYQIPTFGPTYENPSIAKDIFLSQCPLRIYQSGDFFKIPIILGYTNAEALYFVNYTEYVDSVRDSKKYLKIIGLENSPNFDIFNTILKNSDVNENDIDLQMLYAAINTTTDFSFVAGIDSVQRYNVQHSTSPIYYYQNSFDYKESRHRLAGNELNGTAHSDDLLQIFWYKNQPLNPNSRIGIQRRKMARLFTNFAKYLNPTPNGTSDPLLNVAWMPSGPEGLQLEIGNGNLTMVPRTISDTVKELQSSLELYESLTCS
ncbi:cholinesterase 1-like [Aphidius gifuensis]|uniref:cholinesterase 1-like n=1 Tax=Aphidius gifuensis TaxID=684658 RepID=UPI001CDD3B3A|nr:cholinesterase 1-like [Aphidius gifuensis]